MGLADLKKSSTQSSTSVSHSRVQQLTLDGLVDDFIDDANRYALGQQMLTSEQNRLTDLAFTAAIDDSTRTETPKKQVVTIKKGDAPVRKATFTLTESAIAHLATLADDCDVAKSKLIRFLIEHHFNLTAEQRKQKEQSIIVE
ncbi:CopG family transcriptional regulator [Shewanella fidelis]|uniref:CopG family transcriptional regulator n=1 Tax=Shewanella fidelis TaxID=173509 RepID=A0AAW8NS68_9GAMM|nr:CopG family transcriptional regulator [Shewanella fidelis]MDR8524553.1 CopG family transcriptional regulator [Shewanella fidelis]MDW4812029.1 CopG family transcriptional regulator [Shewanella fidelis]MDW4817032.1 CopG family transcriptional regulator [Shewanella fidelis]MDW4821102.1 CopG family transcriptional regulator [Shewanella fidelis]MDW4822635.1 CopG family transcriptional regulator [Shewanella fidelis]